jgi:hypothetical protein
VLLAAERTNAVGQGVNLYSSLDNGATTLVKSTFRNFVNDEVLAKTYNVIDLTAGSIMVNVQSGERTDRGDLYMSGALDHDFEPVLMNNVRAGNRGDVSRIASLRGIYLANVFAPPKDEVVTHITFDNGASWDYLAVPSDLTSLCNQSDIAWCDMHLLGRSTRGIGEPPYSPPGATGIAMATGNVGTKVALDTPELLSTFLTRDGGVTWKKVCVVWR